MTSADTTTLPLAAGTWTLDGLHSSVGFAIRHLGISKVRGTFERFTVDAVVGETLDTTSVSAVIDLTSIDTGNPDRDAHTLSPDLLDAERRPELRYTSTGIVPADEGWTLHGELSIGAATTPVALDLEFGGLEAFPIDGSTHAGFEARGSVDRHDLDLRFGQLDLALGRKIEIVLDVQLVAPTAG